MTLFLLAACDGFGPATDTGDGPPAFRTSSQDFRSTRTGSVSVSVEVGEGDTAFQITLDGKSAYPILEKLRGPDGLVLDTADLEPTNNLTSAGQFSDRTTSINWPIREQDGPLVPGTWTSEWLVVDDRGFATASDLTAYTAVKREDDPTASEIAVRILYARGVESPKLTSAVASAVEHWRELWADRGLTLVERYESSSLDPELPFAYDGDRTVAQASVGKGETELQLVIGDNVDGDFYVYGVAAGIPGTIQATQNSVVVLSWITHAGFDGRFDRDEELLMGETMAHELGHYIGLFHPVEQTYRHWDALRDTPECGSARECEEELGRNLMFPYSLCYSDCVNQVQLTDDQSAVVHTFVGAL